MLKKIKTKNINIPLVLLLLFSSQFIFGQQNDNRTEKVFLQQIESDPSLLLQDNLDFINKAQIQQMVSSNTASINQTLTGATIPGNVIELIQNGNINEVTLTQTGNGNTHLITQNGNGNVLEASVIGDNNFLTIDQFGNDNMINQNLLGNDMKFILSQIGNNNEVIQTGNNQQSQQYQVIQNGNGMKLIIINGTH